MAKGDLDLGKLEDEAEKKEQEKEAGEFKELTEKIGKTLGDKVKEVRVTHRLTASPACLVSDPSGMSMNLERLLKAAGQKVPGSKPILEVNPQHPLVQGAQARVRREAIRGLEPHSVRPGGAGRRRSARRSGHLREAAQRAYAGPRWSRGAEDLDAGELT